jgi:FkbM family methyltransferase
MRPVESAESVKQIIRRALMLCGLDVRRAGPLARAADAQLRRPDRTLVDFITDRDINVVLDVGANVGQFGTMLRSQGYRGKIVSFEPIATVYETLARHAAGDGDWETNNFALGTNTGQATINVSAVSEFSSILPATRAAMQYSDMIAVRHAETIEVRTLDDIYPNVSKNTLLKIDTQGYERQVLEGGRSVLPMLKGVFMELPIVHLYQGTWQFHQAIEFMADAGFVPAQIHPVNFHSTDRVSLIEVDCLFRSRDPRVDID